MSHALEILHEDAHCLVVVKPAGWLTQGRPREGTSLEAELRRRLRPEAPESVYLAAVHRLDRPVSGVMIWGKTPKAARRLHRQFRDREVEKQYWALVEGRPPTERGLWEDWLFEEPTGLGSIVQVCRAGTPRARQAWTKWRREAGPSGEVIVPPGCSWLRLWPVTGRTHQLRVQAAERGWPILGDVAYGATRPFPEGIALHARSLALRHPTLGTPLAFEAALPAAWRRVGGDGEGPGLRGRSRSRGRGT